VQITESREQQECRLVSVKKELLGPPRLQWNSHDPHRASGTSRFHPPIGLPAFSIAAFRSSSMLDQGVWAEVKVGGEHLRLFSEESALGVQATVYNMNARNWIATSETVEDIEQGKDRAANMLGRTLEGRQLRTTFVNSEEIMLGVVSAALIHALSNPANQFF
jgi:hypothetical protein